MTVYSTIAIVLATLAVNRAVEAASFSTTGSMNTSHGEHAAALLPDGQVLVLGGWGGVNNHSDRLSGAEIYNPATETWTATNSMAAARVAFTATLLPNGNILVAGGGSSGHLTSAELFDPVSGTWTNTGAMSSARAQHSAILLPNGKVLAVGGEGPAGSFDYFNYPTNAQLYNPATGTWTNTGAPSVARVGHTATLLPNGKVLLVGGYDNTFHSYSSAELYDPQTGTWTATGSMNTARGDHTATLLPSGKVLVAGGDDYPTGSYFSSAELYDPTTGTWAATGTMNIQRFWHTATLLPNGKVLVVGGRGNSYNTLATAEIYNPADETWTSTGVPTSAREHHTATLLLGGKVLLAGGAINNIGYLSRTELYNSSNVVMMPFSLIAPTRPPNGAFQFSFSNTPDVSFVLCGTTNLAVPFSNWTAMGGLREASPGQYELTNPQAANCSQCFYRVCSP
jgi:WD40 repeat protein